MALPGRLFCFGQHIMLVKMWQSRPGQLSLPMSDKRGFKLVDFTFRACKKAQA
jgi:hypothetical protein